MHFIQYNYRNFVFIQNIQAVFNLQAFFKETITSILKTTSKLCLINAKRKNMCVSCYISKNIKVGRLLLIFFFIFPDFIV